MAYSHVNSKGQTYYLHANKIERSSGKVTTLYYFSREQKEGKRNRIGTQPCQTNY